jgi:hypothetical protein
MRISPSTLLLRRCARVVAVAGLASFMQACKPKPPPPGPAKPPAAKAAPVVAAAETNKPPENLSYFDEQLLAPKGRDPFFPASTRRNPAPPPTVAVADKPREAPVLVLKGVVGGATHRLAVIGSSTVIGSTILETGEDGNVHLSSGVIHITCVEIGEDYAVIKVDGEAQPKRLELSKKGF